jgi:hypothetical protein
MIVSLDRLLIRLDSQDKEINEAWRRLFEGWPLRSRSPSAPVSDILVKLRLREQLPPLPNRPPIFTESNGSPHGERPLSVFRGKGENLWLHFLDGALLKVEPDSLGSSTPSVEGIVTPELLARRRFDDITFTSLAPLLRREGYFLLHAFAACKNGRATVITGPSGSGKTTTGLSLLLAGWELLANDVLLLEERAEGIFALPTPGRVHIRPYSLKLLPDLRRLLGDKALANEGHEIAASNLVGERWSSACSVRSIFFPHIAEGHETTIRNTSPAISLAKLMQESIDRWDEEMLHPHLILLKALSHQADAFDLHLGPDLSSLPTIVARMTT